ncbi:MAG: hypothetical protein Q8P53_03010 [Candidatus Shapirobacteria bacterium]|nr:hypothetical protein [Candidatus Shapirobacteria bacterium]
MPSDPLKIAIKGTTQEHLQIEDVVDNVVILKDGSCAMVMQLSSVNFDLLSEKEQSSLVFAYGGILNSLNFPIQILIRSNTKDVSAYLNNLKTAEEKQINPLLKQRIQLYRKFIEETVKKNEVLSKSFYVLVRFSVLELGIKSANKQILASLLPMKKKSQVLPYDKNYILEKAKANLEPKRDHLMRLFARLGLEIRQLATKELIELFYKIYNEENSINQKIQTLNYTAPMVSTKK